MLVALIVAQIGWVDCLLLDRQAVAHFTDSLDGVSQLACVILLPLRLGKAGELNNPTFNRFDVDAGCRCFASVGQRSLDFRSNG